MNDLRSLFLRALWFVVEIIPLAIYALVGSLTYVAAVAGNTDERMGLRDLAGIGFRNLVVAAFAAMLLPAWYPEIDLHSGKTAAIVMLAAFGGDLFLFLSYWAMEKAKERPMETLKTAIRKWLQR